jgi:hypothetical protein
MFMMREDGTEIGRFKVRKLMSEMKLISKQRGVYETRGDSSRRESITQGGWRNWWMKRRCVWRWSAGSVMAASIDQWKWRWRTALARGR